MQFIYFFVVKGTTKKSDQTTDDQRQGPALRNLPEGEQEGPTRRKKTVHFDRLLFCFFLSLPPSPAGGMRVANRNRKSEPSQTQTKKNEPPIGSAPRSAELAEQPSNTPLKTR